MNTYERGALRVLVLVALIALSIVGTSCKYSAKTGLLVETDSRIDPVGWLAWYHNVPRSRVVALANLLGVDPQKISNRFPVDYYEDLLLSPPLGQRMNWAEVMATVKGYAAMCELDDVHGRPEYLVYFFYAADDTQPMPEAPAMMLIRFDGKVGAIFSWKLHDPDERYKEFEGCIAERGKLGVMPE